MRLVRCLGRRRLVRRDEAADVGLLRVDGDWGGWGFGFCGVVAVGGLRVAVLVWVTRRVLRG